jgi:murein DD-endopeptidase MepM/ murein hydrolase activator NlpD
MWEEKLPVRKYNTIIFVPHAKARFRKLTISSRALTLTALAVVTVLVAAIAFGWAFLSAARRAHQYRQPLAENARLKSSTTDLSHKLEGLSRQFSAFESRTRQLAIVAGLSDAASKAQGGPNLPEDPSGRTEELNARLNQSETQFRRHSDIASSTPTVAPVRGLLNSGFGSRTDPFTGEGAFHPGVDISTRRHEPVLATAEGVVARSGWAGDYGKAVEITHATGYTTIYGHLDVILVKDGQHVHRGEQVGLVGSTGRATGPHLHYEVRKNDRLLNPLEYILDAR